MRGRAQFIAEALQRGRGNGRGETGGQPAAGGDLDLAEHVGLPSPGEIPRDKIGRQRKAGPHEFV